MIFGDRSCGQRHGSAMIQRRSSRIGHCSISLPARRVPVASDVRRQNNRSRRRARRSHAELKFERHDDLSLARPISSYIVIVTHQGLKMRKAGAMTAKVTFKVGPYFRYWWGLSERATVATAALDHQHKLARRKPRKQRHPKEITDTFQFQPRRCLSQAR